MVGLGAVLSLQLAVLGANHGSYNAALQDAQKQKQPLLVLVGADWCPGCQTMKTRVLPSLAQRGGLRGVSFATVDTDKDVETARQLMRGPSIPQLIAFSQTPDGQWHREQLTGEATEAEVQSLIARAVKAQKAGGDTSPGAIGN